MFGSLILALYFQLNSPDYVLTEPLIQEKRQVVYTSRSKSDTYPIYNIPLPERLQRYIYRQCEKYGISFELMLAIAYVESSFRDDAVSYDGSSVGLFQINTSSTMSWLAEETGIENPNPKNPFHSAKMAVWYVAYLRDKYLNESYDEEQVTDRVLLTYRLGPSRSNKYIKKHGLRHPYIDAVIEYKNKLEKGEI